ncbi:MAG: 3-dehydroquinate synthase [Firmicutes bacterium]|nr:3-dehydroquinate synthase [Bacillota bacterium]MDI6705409.1 3-dehydroquinate synthase [Bacillota bacterium]
MKLKKNLVLIGLPGSGKTTLGRFVSRKAGVPFIDTDELIEESTGKTIPQIFAACGETAFREMERETVLKVSQLKGVVIATGGGAWINEDNRKALRENGVVVYLDAKLKELWERLKGEEKRRPLLAEGFSALEELYLRRHSTYMTADRVVDAAAKTFEDLYEEIYPVLDIFEEHQVSQALPYAVDIHLPQKSYPVYISPGLVSSVGKYMEEKFSKKSGNKPKVFIVTNPLVKSICLEAAAKSLTDAGFDFDVFTVPDGEEHKGLEWCEKAYTKLVARRFSRDDVLAALGGGVTGDLGGFVAATYMRGMRFVQIPTTLIGQVDSSVGGKTAVNLPEGKNLVGCFHQPDMVLADPNLLVYLSDYQFRQGLAECIKYGILHSTDFFEFFEGNLTKIKNRDVGTLSELVAGCCRIKGEIVESDERDMGLRMKLNLGHTVGHALEAAAGYGNLGHGDAVALGIIAEGYISKRIGVLGEEQFARIERLIDTAGLQIRIGFSIPQVLEYMKVDKKRNTGNIRFALPAGIGLVDIAGDVDAGTIEEALRYIGGEYKNRRGEV